MPWFKQSPSLESLLNELSTAHVDNQPQLKQEIAQRITETPRLLLTLWQGHTFYYHLVHRETNRYDALGQALRNTILVPYKFIAIFLEILCKRWRGSETKEIKFDFEIRKVTIAGVPSNILYFTLKCSTLAESFLIATYLDQILYEHFKIKKRTSNPELADQINFNQKNNNIIVNWSYLQEDYDQAIILKKDCPLEDKDLEISFLDAKKDFYDYWACKGIPNTRDQALPESTPLRPIFTKASDPIDTKPLTFSLLIITQIQAGLGNYFNAKRVILGLCEQFPKIQINWILADNGITTPPSEPLPVQIKLHRTDALWKVWPLIRALSLKSDIILHLPIDFLIHLESGLGLKFILKHQAQLVLEEYNFSTELAPPRTRLKSGISEIGSLGLIKPKKLTFPDSISEKRSALMTDDTSAKLFKNAPEAPLYMGYVFQTPNGFRPKDLKGFAVQDFLLLFIALAKRHGHQQFKILLPISEELVRSEIRKHPSLVVDCHIVYQTKESETLIAEGSKVQIEIFNLFPMNNSILQELMNYASACGTPIAVTGDQSLMEVLFNIKSTFIYQRLEHKSALHKKLFTIAQIEKLSHLEQLLARSANTFKNQREIEETAEFLFEHKAQLLKETKKFCEIIEAQPNLVRNLAQIIAKNIGFIPQPVALPNINTEEKSQSSLFSICP